MKSNLLVIAILMVAAAVAAQPDLEFYNDIKFETDELTALAFSPDNSTIAVGTIDGVVYVMDLKTAAIRHTLSYHRKAITALTFSPDGANLISSADDKRLTIWDMKIGALVKELSEHKSKINALAVSPDGKLLAAGGDNKKIALWQFPSGYFNGDLSGHKKEIIFLAFDPTGKQLISAGMDNRIIFWNIDQGQSERVLEVDVHTMKKSGLDLTAAAGSQDSRIIAAAIREYALDKGGRSMKWNRAVAFYDRETGSRLKVVEGNTGDMEIIRLSPRAGYLITDNSSAHEYQLSVWDTESGVVEKSFAIEGPISCFDISGDGRWLAVAYTKENDPGQSHLTLWQTSGFEGLDDGEWTPDLIASEITVNDTTPLVDSGPPRSAAVLYFEGNNVEETIARTAAVLLESHLVNSPYLKLLERKQIDKVLDELNLQKQGWTNSQLIEIGKMTEAGIIIIGSVDKLGTELFITAKLVNVEDGKILGIREVKCTNTSLSNIPEMIKILAPAVVGMD